MCKSGQRLVTTWDRDPLNDGKCTHKYDDTTGDHPEICLTAINTPMAVQQLIMHSYFIFNDFIKLYKLS